MTVDAERRAAVVRDYLNGDATKVVAERYGVSAPSVTSWVRKAGGQVRGGARHQRRPSGGSVSVVPAAGAGSTPIEALSGALASGTVLALRRAGYVTVEQVAAATDDQLLQVRNLGVTKLAKLRAAVPDVLEWSTSSAAPKRAVGRFYRELGMRGLLPYDVVAVPDVWRLYQPEKAEQRGRGVTELADRVGSPAPEPLFVVGRQHYWLYDDILAWLAPLLARRWDHAYEMRRREVTRRWARSHAKRRPSSGPSRYGYQGVRRLDDSILSQRRWGAALGYQGKSWLLGYRATPEEAARLYDRGLIAIGERPVNFPDDVATTMLLPEPHIGPKVSVTKVLLQIVEKHGPVETDAMLDLLPSWPVQPTRPTTREKALSVFYTNALKQRKAVAYVEGGWVVAERAGLYPPARPAGTRHDPTIRERVLQAVRDGSTVAEAALACGVSKWTAATWARRAGLSRGGAHRRFTDGQRAEAVAAYAAGEASHRIAKRVGTTHNTILQWVRDAGVEVRPIGRRYDPAVKERVLQAIRDGASAHSVAVANGVDPSVVGNWARAAGVGRRIVQPRFSPEQKADAVAAYRSGETANRIAQRIGSQRNTVLQWVRAAGVEVRPSGPRRSSSPSSLTSN